MGQLSRLLNPRTFSWAVRRIYESVSDRVTRAPSRVEQVRRFVEENAERGDPQDVLRVMDRFAREKRFLMNVGPEKGPLLIDLIRNLPADARVLELGAYCGYSAILIAEQLSPEGRLKSIEVDPLSVGVARANVEYAGCADRAEIIEGSSSEIIPTLKGPFDLVFLDHWKDLYEGDLRLIEEHGLLRVGSTVVADNVGEMFNPQAYLDYVRNCGRYSCENHPSHIEYSDLPDAVEVSVYLGNN